LRREMAAAQDYEQLSSRAAQLRNSLAEAPIVATTDPLPAAFNATLGRLLPLGGTEGVALLLTLVVEIMSTFGLAGLSVLTNSKDLRLPSGRLGEGYLPEAEQEAVDLKEGPQHTLPAAALVTFPKPSLRRSSPGRTKRDKEEPIPPSNVVPIRPPSSSPTNAKGASPGQQGGSPSALTGTESHVNAFLQARVQSTSGASLAAMELREAYEAWCTTHDVVPLSPPKFAAALKALGYDKWKSCGLMRYRDLQLVA
jgi:hypothetical protein